MVLVKNGRSLFDRADGERLGELVELVRPEPRATQVAASLYCGAKPIPVVPPVMTATDW